jgi:membrane protease subunit HflK
MSTLETLPIESIAETETPPRSAWKSKRRISAWILGAWILSGTYIVSTDSQALVTRWGRVIEPRVGSGIHYALPWPIDRVFKLKANQLRRTVIGGDIPDTVLGKLQPVSSQFLSGDQNLLNIRVVAQYSVKEPRDYLFNTADVDRAVNVAVESALARRVAHTAVDDILTTEKSAIQYDVLQEAQAALNNYQSGAIIASVNIENAAPPAEAADAFRSVAGARSDAIRIVNEAEGYASDLVPRARGEAAQLLDQSKAYKEDKINHATGDASRFEAVAAEYKKAPKVTETRVYVEAMEQILPKLKKLIVGSNGNLDLTLIGADKPPATSNGEASK